MCCAVSFIFYIGEGSLQKGKYGVNTQTLMYFCHTVVSSLCPSVSRVPFLIMYKIVNASLLLTYFSSVIERYCNV